jgi:hypothetical protein
MSFLLFSLIWWGITPLGYYGMRRAELKNVGTWTKGDRAMSIILGLILGPVFTAWGLCYLASTVDWDEEARW